MLGSWPEGLAALREHGVRLLDLDGSTHSLSSRGHGCWRLPRKAFRKHWCWSSPGRLSGLPGSYRVCLDASGIALTLQNGFGNVETLQAALGSTRVALGVTTIGARMLEPGYVQHTGEGKVSLGSHSNLAELWRAAAKCWISS